MKNLLQISLSRSLLKLSTHIRSHTLADLISHTSSTHAHMHSHDHISVSGFCVRAGVQAFRGLPLAPGQGMPIGSGRENSHCGFFPAVAFYPRSQLCTVGRYGAPMSLSISQNSATRISRLASNPTVFSVLITNLLTELRTSCQFSRYANSNFSQCDFP